MQDIAWSNLATFQYPATMSTPNSHRAGQRFVEAEADMDNMMASRTKSASRWGRAGDVTK